ncbi:hypothetical protein [Nocardia callitridis]|uniref:Uncharacterized protein n=1 Tax=Nocardia callitridis TaxID=648753 RepID=A0ABP9KZJ0_9NOCA
MSEDSQPRPMGSLLNSARDGQFAIEMKPEDFIYLDRDCEHFKDLIVRIQGLASEVSRQGTWGLGEDNKKMVSGGTLVSRFKTKAAGAGDGNDVNAIMAQHFKIVEDIQEAHRLVRERIMQNDSDWAADFNQKNETLPDRPPVGPKAGPYLLPGGSTR